MSQGDTPKLYRCEICGAEFNDVRALNGHMYWKHKYPEVKKKRQELLAMQQQQANMTQQQQVQAQAQNQATQQISKSQQNVQQQNTSQNAISQQAVQPTQVKQTLTIPTVDNKGDGIDIVERQIPVLTALPAGATSIKLQPEVIMLYEYVKAHGYEGSFSDFISETIKTYFAEHGLKVAVVKGRVN